MLRNKKVSNSFNLFDSVRMDTDKIDFSYFLNTPNIPISLQKSKTARQTIQKVKAGCYVAIIGKKVVI